MINTNYIVSGLERSGTSLVMQILESGGFPVAYDTIRKPDKNNLKGYYELGDGRVINSLIDETFDFNLYKGKAIKITASGLPYLPKGNYKIIYIERDIDEVVNSMDNMAPSNMDKAELKSTFQTLNETIKETIDMRSDIEVLYVKHRMLMKFPKEEIELISNFLGGIDIDKGISVIDKDLWKNRQDYPWENPEVDSCATLTNEEQDVIKKRLKELGYM
jgi:hypothetical protein